MRDRILRAGIPLQPGQYERIGPVEVIQRCGDGFEERTAILPPLGIR